MNGPQQHGPWLVSARWDVAVFGGSALLAFGLLLFGRLTGALDGAVPAWAWIATVVFVDVAHVWATAYRVYLDPDEMRRRPALYLGLPLAAYVAGVALYSVGSASLFWRVLAYVAVLHFVRQQYGWVALYRRRLGVRLQQRRATRFSWTSHPHQRRVLSPRWPPWRFSHHPPGRPHPGIHAVAARSFGRP
jgi:hypothetical protein